MKALLIQLHGWLFVDGRSAQPVSPGTMSRTWLARQKELMSRA